MKKAAILTVLIFAGAFPALAQMSAPPGPFQGFSSNDQTPVTIKADRFEGDMAARRLAWKGHVTARQGKRTIYADRMDVTYSEDWKVLMLEAKGNVKVNMGDAFATADRLILDNTKQVIHLLGSPRVTQDEQIIVGEKMIYEMKTERFTVIQPRIELRGEPKPTAARPSKDNKPDPGKPSPPGAEPKADKRSEENPANE